MIEITLSKMIVDVLKAFRQTGAVVFLILIFGCQLFFFLPKTLGSIKNNEHVFSETVNAVEIQTNVPHYFLSIELTNSLSSISEVHRMSPILLLFNSFNTIKNIFKRNISALDAIHFINKIPIFIRGHALLN